LDRYPEGGSLVLRCGIFPIEEALSVRQSNMVKHVKGFFRKTTCIERMSIVSEGLRASLNQSRIFCTDLCTDGTKTKIFLIGTQICVPFLFWLAIHQFSGIGAAAC